MEQERKDIIIREIKYWREHSLLPEHFCDFLLTLYTEGDEMNDPTSGTSKFSNLKAMYALMGVHLLLALSVVVIYFTDFSFLMQIAIGIICMAIVLYIAKKFIVNNKGFAHLFYLVGAIILFLVLVHITVTMFPDERIPLVVTVILNCIGWVAIGYRFAIKYFLIAGISGILLLFIFAFLF